MDSWFSYFGHAALTLVAPIGMLWLGLAVLTAALWWKRQRRFALASGILLFFVQLIGGTGFSGALVNGLERPYAGLTPERIPTCDAVVMLGGGVEPSPYEVARLHLTAAGDRVAMALELMRLGKASALCVSGGHATRDEHRWIEADLLKQAILERQLTTAPVFSLGGCADTHDEALRVRQLAQEQGWKRLLLVTSAVHQRRALATFRHAGLDVVAAPCNFLTTMSPDTGPPALGLPSHLGFLLCSVWLREEIGWWEYRRRGWIGSSL
ncbi:MAG: hypothetical protein QOE70_5213 [Chthoniobacter sp.]|jgi:uncharacterized SAM-binding protein YcdF (DUF218 family)|nr:hypothetical protein [Chthoniobacter sp.]